MIKRTIQEDLTIINIYAPNTRASQYIRQMLTTLKEEIHSNKIILGDFNTSLTLIDRSPTQKINQETQVLKKNTLDQMDLTDIFSTFCPITAEYTFFSIIHEHSPG